MAGLAHYKNSKISMANYEPVYLNLFEVIITPPADATRFTDEKELVLEEITKISGLVTDVVADSAVEQVYKGAKRRFANSFAPQTTVDLVIGFNVNVKSDDNSLIAYKSLREWCDLIWNPLTGGMSLKSTYIGGPLTVLLHNKANDVLREWVFPTIWPKTAPAEMSLEYGDGAAIYSTEITFCADYWEDVTV